MSIPNVDCSNVDWSTATKNDKLVAKRRVQLEPVNDENFKPKLKRCKAVMDFAPLIITCNAAISSDLEYLNKNRKRTLEDVICPCNKNSPTHELCCNNCFDFKFKDYEELTQSCSKMKLNDDN